MKTLHLSIIIPIIVFSLGSIGGLDALGLSNIILPSQSNGPITISAQYGEIKFDNCGDIRETFLINGTIKMPLSKLPVQIRIYNPNGTMYDSERIPSQQITHDGKYWYRFSLDYGNQTPVGPYEVTVSYKGQNARTSVNLVLPPIIRGPPPDTIRIVDNHGNSLSEVKVGQQVQIEDSITPICDDSRFVYLLQIQDQNQATVSLSWIEGLFEKDEPMNFSETWTPFSPGNYSVNRFLWSSLVTPNALEPAVGKTVEVR